MEAQKRAHRLTFDHHNASDIYGYSTEHELVRDFKHLSRLLRQRLAVMMHCLGIRKK
jgi:hypothetical protein